MNRYVSISCLYSCFLILLLAIACSPRTGDDLYASGRTYGHRSVADKGGKAEKLDETRLSVVEDAYRQLGSKYRYGGCKPGRFDCSGLVWYVYGKNGFELPRSSGAMSGHGRKVDFSTARPGDLLFFGRGGINHVGIVVENSEGKLIMIHSSSSSGVIETDVMRSNYWRQRLRYARSVL